MSPKLLLLLAGIGFWSCTSVVAPEESVTDTSERETSDAPYLLVLGTAQDAGSPQAGCRKGCCADLWARPDATRRVCSIGLVDPSTQQRYLFDATPDMPSQIQHLARVAGAADDLPSGIFLTHAHIGHYTGLMHLGREAMGAREVPVYAMPRMETYLRGNGPWSQLVSLGNINLRRLQEDTTIQLSPKLAVTPLRVPHRDEFSETVGYRIDGPSKSALFIPDIDKWERWDLGLVEQLAQVDYALLDATFYDGEELPGRDMASIPHPFVVESMALLNGLPDSERSKVYFTHFNHTNPLLDTASSAARAVKDAGYRSAHFDQRLVL